METPPKLPHFDENLPVGLVELGGSHGLFF